MSCYEWERGTFKLSVREYRKFLRAFRDGWNKSLDEAYQRAKKLRDLVRRANKGRRGVFRWDELVTTYPIEVTHFVYGDSVKKTIYDLGHAYTILRSLGYGAGGDPTKKPRSPQKKFFKHATNKERTFRDVECCISFDDNAHTVDWSVDENNHACGRARQTVAGRLFFDLLARVTWTRGTGGSIYGNDEYNREDHEYPGAGGNYVKEAFGSLGDRDRRSCGTRF